MSEQIEPLERPEAERRRRYRRGALLSAGALVAVAAATGGYAVLRDTTCLSPRAESDVYPGDAAADPALQSTWRTGITAVTQVPADAEGLIVSYRPPGSTERTDESQLVPADRASEVALRIGHDSVVFATQVVAKEGSAACDTAPDTTFSKPQPFSRLIRQDAALPGW